MCERKWEGVRGISTAIRHIVSLTPGKGERKGWMGVSILDCPQPNEGSAWLVRDFLSQSQPSEESCVPKKMPASESLSHSVTGSE